VFVGIWLLFVVSAVRRQKLISFGLLTGTLDKSALKWITVNVYVYTDLKSIIELSVL